VLPAAPAAAVGSERIVSYAVTIDVRPSGAIHVVETIDYDFGFTPKRGIFRKIPRKLAFDDDNDRLYPVDDVKVTAGPGTPTETKVDEDAETVIRIGDPDRTITGRHRYVIEYDVKGTVNRFEGHDELYWNAVGHEWAVPIERATVVVSAAADFAAVTCFAGPHRSTLPCASARSAGRQARFAHTGLGPYSGVTVVAALPHRYVAAPGPVLEERWKIQKAFAPSPHALGLSGLVLASGLGSVFLLVSRSGRDRRFSGVTPGLEPAAGVDAVEVPAPLFGDRSSGIEYTPPKDMPPAVMGVLLDERADPLDVTATIVDLAVRGYLTVEELPRKGLFGKRDWRLTRLKKPDGALEGYEQKLLISLFRTGEVVEVSDLKNDFHADLADIQDRLYQDVLNRGWFTRRPDQVRGRWHKIGVAAVVAGGLVTYGLARWTHLGLVGLACVVVGVALLAVHGRMPFRTGRGSAALARALGFRRYLATAEAEQLRQEEQAGVFARYLPFAVVLGETERWAKVFRDLGQVPEQSLNWYSGPAGWSFHDFSSSMDAFATSTSGTLAATPASSGTSGFSGGGGGGGGFSGGGGGGGGGGSW
jgi:uncharacterized membrane protein YgcG